jgi:hypothetical protein
MYRYREPIGDLHPSYGEPLYFLALCTVCAVILDYIIATYADPQIGLSTYAVSVARATAAMSFLKYVPRPIIRPFHIVPIR